MEIKRAFYQWGSMMYKTFLFHAQPIPKKEFGGGNGPKPLYHGVNRLLSITDTEPTYQGPFSTTTSKHVANGFSKGNGLIFSLQSSYANVLRSILGIDMMFISCFKHEKEILLYSQSLPIKNTQSFEQNEENLVNHLLFCIKNTVNQITDSKAFYRKIGVRFSESWISVIGQHPILMQKSKFRDRTVEQGLVKPF